MIIRTQHGLYRSCHVMWIRNSRDCVGVKCSEMSIYLWICERKLTWSNSQPAPSPRSRNLTASVKRSSAKQYLKTWIWLNQLTKNESRKTSSKVHLDKRETNCRWLLTLLQQQDQVGRCFRRASEITMIRWQIIMLGRKRR